MASTDDVRDAGARAVASLHQSITERLARLIRSDEEWAAQAVDVGLVDRDWLADPTANPARIAPPNQVVQRFLERTAEQRPSVLANLGLSALQAMSLARTDASGTGTSPVTPVTVVFTDLEGFTGFTATEGDDAAASLVGAHNRWVGPVVRSRGGHIVKRLGDGLMLSFPAPEAAVLAAVELVSEDPSPLRVRAGLHHGDAVVTHDDVVGHVVNVAARLTEQAKGGEALASVDVRAAATDLRGVEFTRARRYRLKGLDPISASKVRRVSSSSSLAR
ncbi:adenylate/guanylate cyclase domain-containing protein [Iamia majanohamensis]|uniref:Adenylate/guanylate cyclase domain-containing protein n=1 Tax=Iamia majanohamensis TaxID=467976 RepID=A0AAE9Y8N0_9ACTN|nr:adenylate/guanylate cyclase domain-containing protein [Iamia majanohamensis]WCO67771.1 adenylate/guanylate cyclase domain-containing protein [Iamia majanohamensis]